MSQDTAPPDLTPKQQQLICALMNASSKGQAAKLAGVDRRTVYRWLKDPVFMEAYRAVRRDLFDDMLATIDKMGNAAALALGRELYRAEAAGGGFVLIHCARRAIKSQSVMAVQEELDNVRRIIEAMRAGAAPAPPAPASAPKPQESKSVMTEQEVAEACRLRMIWTTELGNSAEDAANSLKWNRPESVTEEQGLLDAVRKQLEGERQFTGG